ncbi:hypothetical protein GDO78_020374 [Eleutherodactylus coqui]|uniref:Uncharacterized protein n=1 Tax=Eleutherodactylus coqui TaxID=57060 RepID=A0A8J6E8R9_ELECQ|nr:hypothetical protein GDO78_020374 [Eleutherodactylus coqui]
MAEKKCRQYLNEYLKYGFIPSTIGQLPLCFVCEKAFLNEAMKPLRLSDHLAKMHSDKMGKPISFFQVKEIVSTMLGPDACAMMNLIPLSNDTISRRIDKMAADVEETLLDVLKNTEFVMQIDESTVRDNEVVLFVWANKHGAHTKNEEVVEEQLFTRNVTTSMKGSSIYKRVEEFFQEKNSPLTNVVAFHCLIHQQHLGAKHVCERLHDSLRSVINAVNMIKAHSLNERLFCKLCQDHDVESERLLLGGCQEESAYDAFTNFSSFFSRLTQTFVMQSNYDVFKFPYLADIFDKLNEVNSKLQGDNMNFIKAKCIISSLPNWTFIPITRVDVSSEVKLLVLAFPSMYLVERGFSVVQQLLTKAGNELQICVRGDLGLWLTKIESDIAKLAPAYQAQGSH